MILHLVDDEKIINRTIELFEKVNPSKNKFLIEVPNKHYVLKYVQEQESTITAAYGSEKYWDEVGDINIYSAVYLHNLTTSKRNFILKFINTKVKFVWFLWGADLYDYLVTKGYKIYLWKPNFIDFKLRWMYYDKTTIAIRELASLIKGKEKFRTLYKKTFNRIDYCAIFNKGDYELFEKYTGSKAKWHWFTYYPIDILLGPNLIDEKINGQHIIVGNSGSITGNHIPAFKLLSTLKVEDKKVIVPLSYGNPLYCNYLEKKGYQILGKNFLPLRDFTPLNEYNKILCSASIVIMFQLRQEAVGNILVSLYLGAKVYLQEENNLYQYFISIGVKVFSIKKHLNIHNSEVFVKLSEEDQKRNRRVIYSEFNEENIIRRTRDLLSVTV